MVKHPPFNEVEASRPKFELDYEHHYTQTPQPGWKPGQGLNNLPESEQFRPENAEWRAIDPAVPEKAELYKLMISAITPRPIAFLSTMDADGVGNLSPMSYFNMVAHNPPTIMVSIQANPKNASGLKDTSGNIKQTKEFCCSIISEPFVEAANYTSIDAPSEIDEWKLAGLTKRKSKLVKPPHVAESAFSMECELAHWHEVKTDDGTLTNTVILGRVKRFHMKEFLFDPSDPMKVMPERLRVVSRLGGLTYGRTLRLYELQRPVWDKVKEDQGVQHLVQAPEVPDKTEDQAGSNMQRD